MLFSVLCDFLLVGLDCERLFLMACHGSSDLIKIFMSFAMWIGFTGIFRGFFEVFHSSLLQNRTRWMQNFELLGRVLKKKDLKYAKAIDTRSNGIFNHFSTVPLIFHSRNSSHYEKQ